jgi:phosphatidylserine decarboxylase
MELQIVLSSVVLALLFMWVQSLYWEIRYRVWITAGVIIGLFTAAVMTWVVLWKPDLGPVPLLLIEVVLIGVMAAVALLIWFSRDPERIPPEKEGVIISPADGKIIYVNKLENESHFVSVKAGTRYPLEELLQAPWPFQGGYLVGIEMNVLDVHVNRAPISGKIALLKRIKGGFPGLGKPNAEVRSQRAAVLIENGNILVGVVQIASRFVRGIVSYVKEGQQVEIGQRIGMIRFGSQVDLVIPDIEDCLITVGQGQTVSAGLTVIARYGKKVSPLSAAVEKELATGEVKN